ncbi:hypothetical protein J6590_055800 [Homalodisca vitripennis]|nr:hypothetical protein J6590_055800 [Homalodisca vitripennis]
MLGHSEVRNFTVKEFLNAVNLRYDPVSQSAVEKNNFNDSFKETASVNNRARSGRPRSATIEEQISSVLQSVVENPHEITT